MSINVTQPSMPDYEEYIDEIKTIWNSKYLTNMGPIHNKLEKKLKTFLGVKELSLFTNGHLALENAIQTLNLSGEVITTPYTFISTTHAIVRNGLKPVFCDINEEDYTIDASKIESLITEKTSAIIPVHVYGNICDVEAIDKIAKKYNLKVIYDAAHAFGVKYNGVGVGNFGDISMFSFHATKVFNTIEGGALAYNDTRLKNNMLKYRNFGIDGEQISLVGTNAKMDEFRAAMGICNLRHIEEYIERRKEIYEFYIDRLKNCEGIELIKYRKGVQPNYAYFPILINKEKFGMNRNELYEKLIRNEIFARKYFYPASNSIDAYKSMHNSDDTTPISKYVSNNILCLPMHANLNKNDVNKICNIILQ